MAEKIDLLCKILMGFPQEKSYQAAQTHAGNQLNPLFIS